MGINDLSFLSLIQSKVLSWITDLPWVSFGESWMSSSISDFVVCHDCRLPIMGPGCGHRCRSCGRVFCVKCMYFPRTVVSESMEYLMEGGRYRPQLCKFCSQAVSLRDELARGYGEKLECRMPPCQLLNDRIVDSGVQQSLPLTLSCSTIRSCGEDDKECQTYLLSPSSVFSQDVSDLETSSISTGTELYSFTSSSFICPNRIEQQTESCRVSPKLLTPRSEIEDLIQHAGDYSANSFSTFKSLETQKSQKPFDLDSNGLIWLPPPPKDEADDMKSGFLQYYDDDDDVGGSGMVFKSCSFDFDEFPAKENKNDATKELVKASVYRDFKALVFHFLKVEGICLANENREHSWLETVSSLAWQAANYVKPNTCRGGSMDPGDYVKVKCILCGSPSDSTLVKGVVCTRNVKHKRMITQHRNPKLLILGGALEYQKVPDKLASINTILEQESDHLKMTFNKIEARKPHVVLVEKSVSPYVVDYMLAKGISLVSNVKRPLLERISRCTGAHITDSVDDIPSARLGHCDTFRINRVPEEHSNHQLNRKFNKTLMFFEGCPRRLGCTVLLRGMCFEELKKVKHAVQYASFAAYHLSLETSFLADEGARLPEMPLSTSSIEQEMLLNPDDSISTPTSPSNSNMLPAMMDLRQETDSSLLISPCASSANMKFHCNYTEEAEVESSLFCASFGDSSVVPMDLASYEAENENSGYGCKELDGQSDLPIDVKVNEVEQRTGTIDGNTVSNEHLSAAENNQSILVSLSKSCVLRGTACEKPHLFRIKFYGSFDKPLGKYLSDYIFDQMPCHACKEPTDAHVMCYTHQHGNVTISVKRLPSIELPGEHEGKIWMWHRCLKCAHKDGVPPAGRRAIMSDAAWGLSFGKFLELSFSNHSSANRVASCGHSLQRDCLRFYGLGNMVACFRYSPVDILLVNLPPSTLEFTCQTQQEWLKREAMEVSSKIEILFAEVFDVLQTIEGKTLNSEYEHIRASLINDITELKYLLRRERNGYEVLLLQSKLENKSSHPKVWNILELNNFRRSLLIDSYMWDRSIYVLDSLLKDRNSASDIQSCPVDSSTHSKVKGWSDFPQDERLDFSLGKCNMKPMMDSESLRESSCLEDLELTESNLSDTIDLAWTGSNQSIKAQTPSKYEAGSDHLPYRKVMSPLRVRSFDSALRNMDGNHRLFPAFPLSSSFDTTDACGGLGFTHRETIPSIQRVSSQHSPRHAQDIRFHFGHTPSFVLSASSIASDGARLLLPESIHDDIFVAVYDNEPSSIISYAICSKEHADFVACVSDQHKGRNASGTVKIDVLGYQTRSSSQSVPPANYRCELDDIQFRLRGSDETLPSRGTIPSDVKQNHFRFSFDDESSFPADKVKFSVTCYFAKQFSALRMKCCPNEMDFICCLSRCKKWSAQGGKSNVYFAKTLDERFIIKQVTKTELDAFEGFAPQYFEYLSESIKSGSPSCLAKILGLYQVAVKHLKGGKEERMDLMVMENLFFARSISRVYDLKGSSRSRYIPDTTGSNKVLLDLNLLETLRTNPIFLGSRAKRTLERAVWNDTAFLASVGVMDYSLLVGVDNERKELVIGIIDFMRQYTWDKQLETWAKASGILGGPKNAAPTVVSPDVYKKRFRKAMSSYFLTVPDQWHS